MTLTLRGEVEAFLRAHGPATSTEIAKGVRVRRSRVDEVLASDGFVRMPRPEGRSIHTVYYGLSRRVPRAQRMLEVLRDGDEHSRAELLSAGVDHTNNAAAELRADGYDVRFSRRGGGVYRIEALSERDPGHGASSLASVPASAGTGRQPEHPSRSLSSSRKAAA